MVHTTKVAAVMLLTQTQLKSDLYIFIYTSKHSHIYTPWLMVDLEVPVGAARWPAA